jgi:hypothetical protein
MDHLERLRGLARIDWPAEVALLVGTLSEDEWERLTDLLRACDGPISREAVRGAWTRL